MSPEVVFKKPYNTNIDVWSLGILLYELTTGSSPFRAKNVQEITQKFQSQKEICFPDYLSLDLKNLISGILKMDSEKRMTIKQILSHKWLKKMYITTGYEEMIGGKITKIAKIHQNSEHKPILCESKTTKTEGENDYTVKSPKQSSELSITKVRRPIFFENKKINENNFKENSAYYNKTEYHRFRNSNHTNLSNASFLNRTNNNNNLSLFKSIDNSKKHRIFLKEENEKNQGKILKTMENLMSQINASDNKLWKIKPSEKILTHKNQNEMIQTKKQNRFLFGETEKDKKENIH